MTTITENWQVMFGKSIAGFLVAALRKDGEDVPVEEVPPHVYRYLLMRDNGTSSNTDVDQEVLDTIGTKINEWYSFTITCDPERERERAVAARVRELEPLECMSSHLDGSHRGLSDWYPEIEQGIQEALNRGPRADWTTGRWGSKHEIASAEITCIDGTLYIAASTSDDFDTEGVGRLEIPHTTDIEKVKEAVDEAWNLADEDRKQNREYRGFSVLKGGPGGSWVETYIANFSEWGSDSPPGDNYHEWGWQGECKIPREVREKLEDWAIQNPDSKETFTYKGWTIRPWSA